MKGKNGEIIAGNRTNLADLLKGPAAPPAIRRCRSCGVRKVLARGFYRDRTSRGGYRQTCKKCRNRERAKWARENYSPKTGRRYVTKLDRAASITAD